MEVECQDNRLQLRLPLSLHAREQRRLIRTRRKEVYLEKKARSNPRGNITDVQR